MTKKISRNHFWLFPSTMLNVYSFRVSINIVMPIAESKLGVPPDLCVGLLATLDRGADAALDRVEREDVVVLENASAASARGFTSADG